MTKHGKTFWLRSRVMIMKVILFENDVPVIPAITNEERFANELSSKPCLSFPISNNSSDGRSMLKEYE